MSGRINRLLGMSEKEENFWPTFSDLLSVIMFIILLTLVSYIFVAQVTTIEVIKVQEMINKRVTEIVGFREKIYEELSSEFSESNMGIYLDKNTAAISFSGDVLFEVDSDVIKPEFKAMLIEFFPVYTEVLLSEENKDIVSQIIIEGHTDDTGDYMYNLDLSQRRAASVVKFILGDEFPDFKYKEELKHYITANGKSESSLIYNEDGTVNRSRSRRVEIKFTIKDQYLIEKMQEIIDN